jgi:hypothetical protein
VSAALVLLAVLVLLVVAGGAAVLTLSGRRRYRAGNVVVPGVETGAPPGWAGAHSTEARLHRRIVAAVRALTALDDPGLTSEQAALEAEALALDRRLVTVAALPERTRAAPLAEVERAVVALEDAVAAAATGPGAAGLRLEETAAELQERRRHLAEARAELQRLTCDLGGSQGDPASREA